MKEFFNIFVSPIGIPVTAFASMLGCVMGFFSQIEAKWFVAITGGLSLICMTILWTINRNSGLVGISEGLQSIFYGVLGFCICWFIQNKTKKKAYHDNHKKR